METELKSLINDIKESGLYRSLRAVTPVSSREVLVEGKAFINFSSNNYLGLSNHPALKKAAAQAIEKYGCGGTSSRLIAGTFEIHAELETRLAAFKGKERALVFPSGFAANIGLIPVLAGPGDCVIMDRLNHASLWDAVKLSKARVFVYDHLDMGSLEKVLKRAARYKRRLVITDSLFSMDGDIAPLYDLADLCKSYDAISMIDEAHATGVFGKNGSGLAESFDVTDKIDIIMGTLSKALGSQGGFVCSSGAFVEYLINKSRSFIYTTSLSPACAGAAIAAIDLIMNEPQRRSTLLKNSGLFLDGIKTLGYDTLKCESQIIPLVVGSNKKAMELSAKLYKAGILAPAIRPPTVEEGKCRLRFSLTSEHTIDDIKILLEAIQ
jgi:8-amino-7-oxononanoate synthase